MYVDYPYVEKLTFWVNYDNQGYICQTIKFIDVLFLSGDPNTQSWPYFEKNEKPEKSKNQCFVRILRTTIWWRLHREYSWIEVYIINIEYLLQSLIELLFLDFTNQVFSTSNLLFSFSWPYLLLILLQMFSKQEKLKHC